MSLYSNTLSSAMKPFRVSRMNRFFSTFNPDNKTKIIDIGGSPYNWELSGYHGDVTLLNITAPTSQLSGYTYLSQDATNLAIKDNSYDIGFSNSVIEHVGSWDNQVRFAKEISRVAKSLWVQTPAKWFPVDMHFLTPFFHWLPKRYQKKWSSFTFYGLVCNATKKGRDNLVDELRLLTYEEMKTLFPDCEIVKEKFLGLTKSYIAIRITWRPKCFKD